MSKRSDSNSTLFRALLIMEKIVESERPVSSAYLAEMLALPKATVHRIAQQLEEEGYLQREPVSRRFVAGRRLRDFSLAVLSNAVLGAPRHAVLQSLSEEIGETCNCTMLDGNQIIYFDRVEANWPYRIHLPPGSRLPLHCTASGKLFLASMAPAQRRQLLVSAPLKRHTERTITDPELLEHELQRIAEQGYGVDNEELLPGMVALALPVTDDSERICFTVAVHAPTVRKPLEELHQYLPALRRAAAALSANYCSGADELPASPPRVGAGHGRSVGGGD